MRRAIAGLAVVTGLLAIPTAASADHHFMKIREVFTGSDPVLQNNAFVELQMYASGQNAVDGHYVSFYSASGENTPVAPFTEDVMNGQNQRTVLIGDEEVVGADLTYDVGGETNAAGGAVCFESTVFGTIDCVSWGTFPLSTIGELGDEPVGDPVAPTGIPDGQSITRSIAPGCATLLEDSDDTDDSATDFQLTAPTPRPNSVAPTEQPCGGGPGGDNKAPQTEITKAPKRKLDKAKTKVKFTSSEPGSTFECKLDKKGWKRCKSPRKLKRLDDGKHKFKVRATDPAGNTDPTPAKAKFKVVD